MTDTDTEATRSAPVPPATGGRILVVDDEEAVAALLASWLSDEGYDATEAHGFEQVRAALAAATYDLATLDIMMPGVDGLETLRWLREHHPDMGAIMVTALGDLDTVLQALRAGAVGYLLKPFNLDLVSQEIARAMERQRLIAENRAHQRDLERRVAEQTEQLRRAYDELQRRVRELEGRDRLVHFQASGPDQVTACHEILRVAADVVDLASAIAYCPDAGRASLRPVAAIGLTGPGEPASREQLAAIPAVALGDKAAGASGLVAEAFTGGVLRHHDDGTCAAPLVYREETLGVLAVSGLAEAECEVLSRLALEAAVLLWSARVAEELASGHLSVDELLDLE